MHPPAPAHHKRSPGWNVNWQLDAHLWPQPAQGQQKGVQIRDLVQPQTITTMFTSGKECSDKGLGSTILNYITTMFTSGKECSDNGHDSTSNYHYHVHTRKGMFRQGTWFNHELYHYHVHIRKGMFRQWTWFNLKLHVSLQCSHQEKSVQTMDLIQPQTITSMFTPGRECSDNGPGAHCIKLLPEKNSIWLFQLEFFSMVKVDGKILLTGVFRFYPSSFYKIWVKVLCNRLLVQPQTITTMFTPVLKGMFRQGTWFNLKLSLPCSHQERSVQTMDLIQPQTITTMFTPVLKGVFRQWTWLNLKLSLPCSHQSWT